MLDTQRLLLTLPRREHIPAVLYYLENNRTHLQPWNPPEPPGLYTHAYWERQIAEIHELFEKGTQVRFWLFEPHQPSRLVGTIGFSQIFRGPFCSCTLGYQLDHQFEGQGYMTEALRAAIRYMFEEQQLHRIAANYRPENIRSGRLLARLGFHIEGFAKNYLYVDGAWRDHILTALINDAFLPVWLLTPSSLKEK